MGSIVCSKANYEHPNYWNDGWSAQECADWNDWNGWSAQECADWNDWNGWSAQECADWNAHKGDESDDEGDYDEGDDDGDYDEGDEGYEPPCGDCGPPDDFYPDDEGEEGYDEGDDEGDDDGEYKREFSRLYDVWRDLTTLVAAAQLVEVKELGQLKKHYYTINFTKVLLELCHSDQERSEKQDKLDGLCESVRVFEMVMLQNTLSRCDRVSDMQIAEFEYEMW
jgi:hypothetical protein